MNKNSFYLASITINLFIIYVYLTLYPYTPSIFDTPSICMASVINALIGLTFVNIKPIIGALVVLSTLLLTIASISNFLVLITIPVLE